jgi:hypothetical protein
VANPRGVNQGVVQVTLDGEALLGEGIPLLGDDRQHEIDVLLG